MSPETRAVVLRTLSLDGHARADEAHGGVLVSVVRHAIADLQLLMTQAPTVHDPERERVFLALQGLLGRLEAGLDVAYEVPAEGSEAAS